MTKNLQSAPKKIIVKCILGVIILSLIFSTMNFYINKDSEKYIATVNNEKISFYTLQKMYLIEREKQKKILGKNFFKLNKNKNFIKKTYDYVLSQLINNILLEQYVKKIKLQANEFQIKEIILNSPMFQKHKKFDKEKYFKYLNSINLTNHEYINIIKTKINTENLINAISNTNFILQNEQQQIINLLSQKRTFTRAVLKINNFIQKQNINNIEAKSYFNRYKKNFYIPEKFKINFIQFTLNNFKTNANEKEINEWYLKNINKYLTKEKRKYSIIQINNKNTAEKILSQLKQKPEYFPKIAKEQSTDPISSKKNGDIGWISIDLIPNEIKNAHLNQKNSISSIIPFNNEFLIIKLDEISISKQKKVNEVYKIIEKEINHQKSLNLYNKLKNKISDLVQKHPNQFDVILKKSNLSSQETDWFDKSSIPIELNNPILKKVIFNTESIEKDKNKIKSHVHFITLKNNQFFLINIKNFQNKKIQKFNDVKNNIIKNLKIVKAIKETKKIAENIIIDLNKGNTNLFKKSNLYFGETETISRYDDNPITSIVFSLPHPEKGKKIYTLYQDENKNFIIILLKNISNKNFSKKEKNIIIEYLEKNNTETLFNALLRNLHETSKIKIYQ
ncbi:peptidylprolyl isomerase [Buchnera aphidicola (Brachycaudus cardui)]|uniref:Periplasmic chaperone PpiD n=1 Tax=Buchnera aphidicola (Brachycaudus cardui) TaxID=557993 RepID=A0A4D6Y1Y7_9GAMM|nr:SurA N-terminal domain-containing protein [Buchnera aphidicola]QCI20604.1 peptidylprolyl isomerase [Buchnera aphidicola (Brachycaudus cardui)]